MCDDVVFLIKEAAVRQNIQVNLMSCTHLALFLTEERFDEKFITLSAEILGDDDLILAIQSAGV